MSMGTEDLLTALNQRAPAIGYYVNQRLRFLFPSQVILESGTPAFNLEAYAGGGLCILAEASDPQSQRLTHWIDPEQGHVDRPHNTLFEVTWRDHALHVVIMHWVDNVTAPYHYFILAASREVAEEFHAAVCTWNTPQPDEYIWVFDVHGWNKDESLSRTIKDATLENLILRGDLKTEIVRDITTFFDSREMYAEYGIPWKRGILFVGPAGNGKTHAIKALINTLDRQCLYVKTFGPSGGPDPLAIRAVFDQARASAPCILVLEDLDSLVTAHNRSYFLNELDGFAGNDGILTLATTNHPDVLDPAIVDRPSRFDRKYPFDLPAVEERAAYITHWNDSIRPALRVTEGAIAQVAEGTEGFSFAYLKELFVSAMMRWVASNRVTSMDEVMTEQVGVLRSQMSSMVQLPSDPDYGPQFGHPRMGMRGPAHPRPGFGQNPQDIPL